MKRIDEKTVIDTLADCLRQNASLGVGQQKDAKAIASDVATAFRELDSSLSSPRRRTGGASPASRGSR